jgi:hypothetical protein
MKLLKLLWDYRSLVVIVALSILAAAGWGLADSRGKDITALGKDLKAQEKATADCETERDISYETSEKYQDQLSNLDRKLRALRVQYSTACIKIEAPGGSNATTAPGKLSGQNGITAEALLDFAGQCERERIKVIGLQEYSKRLNE